jgi:hypothetical protein
MKNPSDEVMADESMVAVFSSSNHDGELEAMAVKGVLDSNNIPSIIVGPQVLPSLEFQVQVSADKLEAARLAIRDARQGGRRAADEAEALTEQNGA